MQPSAFYFKPEPAKLYFENTFKGKTIICEDRIIGSLNAWHNGLYTKEYARRLKQVFPNAKIILFIRNQLDMIVALYSQYLHHGGNYSIRKFLFHKNDSNFTLLNQYLFSLESLDYSSVINHYMNLFGKDRIHVYHFEDFLNNTPEFLNSFINEFKFEVNIKEIDFSGENIGYKYIFYPFVRISNAFTSKGFFFKYYLVHIPKMYEYSHSFFRWLNKYNIFGKRPTPQKLLGKRNHEILSERFHQLNQNLLNIFPENKLKDHGYIV